jgi:hypothetical protein
VEKEMIWATLKGTPEDKEFKIGSSLKKSEFQK